MSYGAKLYIATDANEPATGTTTTTIKQPPLAEPPKNANRKIAKLSLYAALTKIKTREHKRKK